MNTEKLTKLIVDLDAKLDEMVGYGTVTVEMQADGMWVVMGANSCDPKCQCDDKKDADNIAAIYNGYRKQLEVALEWVECYKNCPIEGFKMTVLDIVRGLLTPTADALGVEYDS